MIVRLLLTFLIALIVIDKVRLAQESISDLNGIYYEDEIAAREDRDDNGHSHWQKDAGHSNKLDNKDGGRVNNGSDSHRQTTQSELDKRYKKNFCHSNWSIRKCEQKREASGNHTYITCSSKSPCRHYHHCCSVHDHHDKNNIQCCVKHRRHKKKHRHTQKQQTNDPTTSSS